MLNVLLFIITPIVLIFVIFVFIDVFKNSSVHEKAICPQCKSKKNKFISKTDSMGLNMQKSRGTYFFKKFKCLNCNHEFTKNYYAVVSKDKNNN